MKKFLKFSFAILAVIFCLAGCKKPKDSISYETKISFTYNGQQYTRTHPSLILPDVIMVQGTPLFVNFTGLDIADPSLFGGDIFILTKNTGSIQCAYLRPTGTSVYNPVNCNLTNGANPIDSVQVYWYESGSLNFSWSDCRDLTGTTIPGQKDCGITGSFDLVLTNKNNLKIRLTNGSFSGRNKKYP